MDDAAILDAMNEWPADVLRLRKALGKDAREATRLWLSRSDAWSAGWMILPRTDDEIRDAVSRYAE